MIDGEIAKIIRQSKTREQAERRIRDELRVPWYDGDGNIVPGRAAAFRWSEDGASVDIEFEAAPQND